MNDHLRTALVVASGDPGTEKAFHSVEEFGHFVNATLLQETRSFIIVILRGNVIENRDGTISQH